MFKIFGCFLDFFSIFFSLCSSLFRSKIHKKDKFGLQVSKDIAGQFGRHSVKVMETSYLQKQKNTNAIDAYNLIREAYDLTGFDENQEFDPFNHQRQVLQKIKNQPPIQQKRQSLEIPRLCLSNIFPCDC